MDYKNEILEIEKVIQSLRALKRELISTQKKSEKAFNTNYTTHSIRACEMANVSLNWQCMTLDKQRKETYKSILKAGFLKVEISETEYNPSGFHKYKG